MGISQSEFSRAQDKAVDKRLPVGGWRVYRAGYEINYRNETGGMEGETYPLYVQARLSPVRIILDPDGSGLTETGPARLEPDTEIYPPMRLSGLFLEFARLFNDEERNSGIELEDVAPVVLDFVAAYGCLGTYDTYLEPDGWSAGRYDDRQSVVTFRRLSVEAVRALKLYETANHPDGPDATKLRAMGVSGDTPKQRADRAEAEYLSTLDKNLENETFTRMYRHRDRGRLQRGPGFHSLLGALWLQFAALVEAEEEEITRCRWCGDVVNFEPGEPSPGDAPKGKRGGYKTRVDREFCPLKHGRKDHCKNKFNYERRKKQATP